MKFLLLNQAFYPDVVSTGQHLTDLALGLAGRGHEVKVVTSRRAYDDPRKTFPPNQMWRGIRIFRVSSTGFGKGAKWKRALDFASFTALCLWRLLRLPRHDVVVALTSPPLIAFFGAWLARLRGSKFVYWVMDFNPDEAIAAGWLKPSSFAARMLEKMSHFSLKHANRIVALDRFMRDRIVAKGVPSSKVVVLAPWAHMITFGLPLRSANVFGKPMAWVANSSSCIPETTAHVIPWIPCWKPSVVWRKLLRFTSASSEGDRISSDQKIGPDPAALERFVSSYQPLDQLSASLSAADLHVVIMGEPFVGLVHPCKIYNILNVAAPVLYIGPEPSHVTEILAASNGHVVCATARHADINGVVNQIQRLRNLSATASRLHPESICAGFAKETLLPKMIGELESSIAN